MQRLVVPSPYTKITFTGQLAGANFRTRSPGSTDAYDNALVKTTLSLCRTQSVPTARHANTSIQADKDPGSGHRRMVPLERRPLPHGP